MNAFEDSPFDPQTFSGEVRLFPLPNIVLFPHVLLPLHIFEPRYRALTAAALAADRLMAITLLEPGWESDYEGSPPIHRIACLGRIVSHRMLTGGRYNLLLQGLARVRIVDEAESAHTFRTARAELLADVYSLECEDVRDALCGRLISAFTAALPLLPKIEGELEQVLDAKVPLGALTDIITYALPLPCEVKQHLLAERDVDRRALALIHHFAQALDETAAGYSTLPGAAVRADKFPPDFSEN